MYVTMYQFSIPVEVHSHRELTDLCHIDDQYYKIQISGNG
jgi:hypothetical protein